MRTAQTIKTPAGDDLVVLPKADYERLVAAAREKLEDETDARAAARVLARLESGAEQTVPFEVVKRLRTENRIKVLREYQEMTQRELAEAAGMNPLYLSQIECGRATGGIKSLSRLAKALGVSLDMIAPLVTPHSDRDPGVSNVQRSTGNRGRKKKR
jgi:DNA-binding XRE family transcriptional regulator